MSGSLEKPRERKAMSPERRQPSLRKTAKSPTVLVLYFIMAGLFSFGVGRSAFAGCTCGCYRPDCDPFTCDITCEEDLCDGWICPGGDCNCRCSNGGLISCGSGWPGCGGGATCSSCGSVCPNATGPPCDGSDPCDCGGGETCSCGSVCYFGSDPCGGTEDCATSDYGCQGGETCSCGSFCSSGSPPCGGTESCECGGNPCPCGAICGSAECPSGGPGCGYHWAYGCGGTGCGSSPCSFRCRGAPSACSGIGCGYGGGTGCGGAHCEEGQCALSCNGLDRCGGTYFCGQLCVRNCQCLTPQCKALWPCGPLNCLQNLCHGQNCDCGDVCPRSPPCGGQAVGCDTEDGCGPVVACSCGGTYCPGHTPCDGPTYCYNCFEGQGVLPCSRAGCPHCGATGSPACGGSGNCTLPPGQCTGCGPMAQGCDSRGSRNCQGSKCCGKGCNHGQEYLGPCGFSLCKCRDNCNC
jgi:hypothetical protein